MSASSWSPEPGYDESTALLVVDLQNDFADPRGSLHVPDAGRILPVVNAHMAAARAGHATVVLTQDWHPPESPHFADSGGDWPVHCVRGTWGADLHPDLGNDADLILRKGTGGEDGYSAFTLVDPLTGASRATGLAGYLHARSIERVVVVGLAADVCVKATAIDSTAAGFETTVPWTATRPVDSDPDSALNTIESMRSAGVQVAVATPSRLG